MDRMVEGREFEFEDERMRMSRWIKSEKQDYCGRVNAFCCTRIQIFVCAYVSAAHKLLYARMYAHTKFSTRAQTFVRAYNGIGIYVQYLPCLVV